MELVKGDAQQTIPAYLADNQHTVVALLYLDFDLFEPTLAAIRTFLPRMPKGAVLAFDELNQKYWPGETLAVLESAGIRNLRIRRFPFTPQISYAVLD
ncbi:putative dTDP-6-deoxy-L-hexose 3-O-methyltransferase [Mycobacterium kansasii 732]|nr:putative dTDP-6-deoxy-L-hexose 3-O-methyltransferase [Mycobacterium kansasii 732]